MLPKGYRLEIVEKTPFFGIYYLGLPESSDLYSQWARRPEDKQKRKSQEGDRRFSTILFGSSRWSNVLSKVSPRSQLLHEHGKGWAGGLDKRLAHLLPILSSRFSSRPSPYSPGYRALARPESLDQTRGW